MPTQVAIPGFDIALTAASGQCFRFDPLPDGRYRVLAGDRVLLMRDLGGGRFAASCSTAEWQSFWGGYFDLGRDYEAVKASVPPGDGFLSQAVLYAGGLRILRQEPFETLIGFIISQRKSLPAIKGCVEALARRLGSPIGEGLYAFPRPDQLAGASEETLRACGLGYRAPYVAATSRLVARGEIDLREIGAFGDRELQNELLRFPGVGPKVADCVMLFAYGRTAAFPKDVWILRAVEQYYGGLSPQEKLGEFAGILQQYMFCYIRHLSHLRKN